MSKTPELDKLFLELDKVVSVHTPKYEKVFKELNKYREYAAYCRKCALLKATPIPFHEYNFPDEWSHDQIFYIMHYLGTKDAKEFIPSEEEKRLWNITEECRF